MVGHYAGGMRQAPRNVRELLGLLGGFGPVAKDLGLSGHEVPRAWAQRNRVPLRHWPALRDLARRRRVPLTERALLALQLNPAPDAPQPRRRRSRAQVEAAA